MKNDSGGGSGRGSDGKRGTFLKKLFTLTTTTATTPTALLILFSFTASAKPQEAVVIVPFTDVWSRPLAPGTTGHDDWRETQVLLGEKVLIHESSGPWVRIEALEQPEFTHHNKWEGYPGWAKSSAFRAATSFPPCPGMPLTRINIVENAAKKMGTPYLWGGLTAKGIDCSGLIHESFRFMCKEVPRDSHEQWMKATPIRRAQMQAGDLIFSAKAGQPKKITHVTLYAGNFMIIEAPQTGMVVRKISFREKYGKSLSDVESGDRVGDRVIYFGTFLKS